ncbi:MAG: hypothetical protein ACD_20C00363G0013 [uncultured bacterium]|nr:MAG: hypothetical protein ACD_20C00363G0013 [uncultured bacterium]HBH18313.1 cytochrome C biogenesis protein [Cyanobacteria bacterium UBA9579]
MDNIITQLLADNAHTKLDMWLFGAVFLGGIITSLSPCTLGLLPIIIGYVGGCSENSNKKTAIQITFFVIGLSLVLTALGITAAIAGKAFGFHANPIWAIVMASLILIMGLSLLEIIEIPMPSIIKQMPQNKGNSLVLYPLLIGAAFAFASSPCSTPVLAGIMAYTSLKANIIFGGLLLFFFSLGQGVVLVIAGLSTSLFKRISYFKSISGYFVKFSGIILIIAASYIYLKSFQIL